jgi:putative phosphoesterase
MRILCVSDTHGDTKRLRIVLAKFGAKLDMILHSGDGDEDIRRVAMEFAARRIALAPLHFVRGNADADFSIPDRLLLESAGKRIFLTHGHLLSVHDDFERLLVSAKAVRADIAVFGHTHDPYWEEIQGILLLNPGSLSRPRRRDHPTFAVLTIPENPDSWYEIAFFELGDGIAGPRITRTGMP